MTIYVDVSYELNRVEELKLNNPLNSGETLI